MKIKKTETGKERERERREIERRKNNKTTNRTKPITRIESRE